MSTPKKQKQQPKKHKNPKVKGHGDYSMNTSKGSGKSIIQRAVAFAKPVFHHGLKLAGVGMLKSLIHKIGGHGDYKMHGMPLSSMGIQPPMFAGRTDTVICHREYVQDITGSAGLTNRTFDINPTNVSLFPWLAAVASCYEEWELSGLIVEFKSTSSTALNSTNTALGTVVVACNYDVEAPAFTSKFQMENYDGAMSYEPSDSFLFPVECKRSQSNQTKFYTDQTTSDKRLSYLGKLQIATVGMQAPANIGELWVTYKVRLVKPRLPQASTLLDWLHVNSSGTGITNTTPLGVGSIFSAHGRFSGTTLSGNTLTIPRRLPEGSYMVLYLSTSLASYPGGAPTLGFDGTWQPPMISSANSIWHIANGYRAYSVGLANQTAGSSAVFNTWSFDVVDTENPTNGASSLVDSTKITLAVPALTSQTTSEVDFIILPIGSCISSGYWEGSNTNPSQLDLPALVKRAVSQYFDQKTDDDSGFYAGLGETFEDGSVEPPPPSVASPVVPATVGTADVSNLDPGTLSKLMSLISPTAR